MQQRKTPQKTILKRSLPLACSLALLACQPAPQPLEQPVPSIQAAAWTPSRSIQTLEKPKLSAEARYSPETQQLDVTVKVDFSVAAAGFQTQGLDCDAIVQVKGSVNGLGIADGEFVDNAVMTGCSGTSLGLSFTGVPVGKSRVLVIEAEAAGNQTIPGALIMAALDLDGTPQTIIVDQYSTPLAEVIKHLTFDHGDTGRFLLSKISLDEAPATGTTLGQFVKNAVDSATALGHPRLVNTSAIAQELINKDGDVATFAAASTFVQSAASAEISLSGPDGSYEVGVRDPFSTTASVNMTGNSAFINLNSILPGSWILEVKDTTLNTIVHSETVELAAGEVLNKTVNLPLPVSPVSAWELLEGPLGGNVHSLTQVAGNEWLAGTGDGLYRTGNITNVAGGSPWAREAGLGGKKVLSLLRHSTGTLYAGVNAGALSLETGGNHQGVYFYNTGSNAWEPVTDSNLTNIDVYDLVEGSFDFMYGATSDGVVEYTGTGWSKVNGPASLLAGMRVGDIDFDGAEYFIAVPDLNKVFRSASPGSGWSEITGFFGGQTPLSVDSNGSFVFVGAMSGNVFRYDGSTWSGAGDTQPGAPVAQLEHHLDGGADLRLIAATNGQLNGGNSRAVQSARDASGPPPFATDDFRELGSNGVVVNSPFVHGFAKTDAFNTDSLSGLLIGTAGAGVSLSLENTGNTLNGGTGSPDVDWQPVNAGLVASEIEEIASYDDGGTQYYYVATKGYGVHRYNASTQTWVFLSGLPADNGRERFPEALTVDVNGTLYATYGQMIVALQAAHSAAASTPWVSLNPPVGTGQFTDMTTAVSGTRLVLSHSDLSGGQVFYSNTCPVPPATCTVSWSAGQAGGTDLLGNFYSVATSPADSNLLYLGGFDTLHKSTDGGANWVDLNLSMSSLALMGGQKVERLTVAQNGTDPAYLYFALTGGSPGGPTALYGYFNDGTANWLDLSAASGLPTNEPALAVAVQPNAPDKLLVSMASGGVYVSEDATQGNSATFAAYNADSSVSPPVPTAAQIRFHALHLLSDGSGGFDVLGGSHGRGVYRSPF